MAQSTRKMLRVGCWMSDKKIRKLNFTTYCEKLRRDHGIEMILLSLDKPLDEQGPFDLVMHKLTDVMAAADAGDKRSEAAVERAEAYFHSQPDLRLLDPLSSVRNLTDRDTCYSLMKACTKTVGGVEIASPNFATIHSDTIDKAEALRACNVSFPIVCKPIVAHGSDLAHKMSIIFNEEHLCDMQTPCVAQQFVNHSAVLHKVFVIGESHYIVQRPSIKNLIAGDHDTIFFDSHDVSKATSDSYLNQMERGSSGLPKPSEQAIEWLVKRLRKTMSLSLFGVDIIIENDTLRHIFIDVNYFPGYDGVTDMFPAFTRLLTSHASLCRSPSSDSGVSSGSVDNHTAAMSTACSHIARDCPAAPASLETLAKGFAANNGVANGHDDSDELSPCCATAVLNANSSAPSSGVSCNSSPVAGSSSNKAAASSSSSCSVMTGATAVQPIHSELLPSLVNGAHQADDVVKPKSKRQCEYDSSIIDGGSTLPNGHLSTLHVLS
eukprot:scpid46594/ scgid18285/ Inositol-tetrakisphosphate 1-kinase; Inositol 1,3,4-trisphosphate 5/6-kinase